MHDYIKNLVKGCKLDKTKIDNNVFKLHYKFSVIVLILFCILLSSKQFFGDPISCDVDSKDKAEIINVFCWITGTFIIDKNVQDLYLSGLGNHPSINNEGTTKMLYYQWIFLIFCLQAACFYFPRYLWKNWEGGLLSHIVNDLTDPIITDKWSNSCREKIVQYMLNSKYSHNIYIIRYTFCEILNLINVILQVCFVDWYLGGKFSSYGISISTDMTKTMTTIFPKITKCTYFRYGASGSVESRDAMCILPLNVLNEKFFVILWYWFFILMFITTCAVVYRGLFVFWKQFRMHLLKAQTRNIDIDRKKIQVLIDGISIGDFYVLYRMGQSVNPIIFKEIILGMYDELSLKRPMRNFPPHCQV